MVNVEPTDVIALEEFPLAWRINDPRWASLPAPVLGRLRPLTTARSRTLFEASPLSRPFLTRYDRGRVRVARRTSLEDSGSPEDGPIRQWFRNLPIGPACEVYLCWGDATAAVVDWGTFAEVWDDLWYPFDNLAVFDEMHDWWLVFGPDEEVIFLEATNVSTEN